MKLPIYQLDAFTDKVFGGNPAAVVPLESWLDDAVLQKIAEENNLSETAFFVPQIGGFGLRWFTPVSEVDLCGHATLASAYVLFEILGFEGEAIVFETKSGKLTVTRETNGMLLMDFPLEPTSACEAPKELTDALGITPLETFAGTDYMVVLDDEEQLRTLQPDFVLLSKLERRGVIVTAKGDSCDFVSRFFAPKLGIDEDPVTGSAHCALAPYWAKRLGRTMLNAKQLSKRGGEIRCALMGSRVILKGYAAKYMTGEIEIKNE